MPWLQIRIPTLPQHTETLEDALLVAGCQAVTLLDTKDQPVFEPIRGTTPLWQHTTIQGLFEQDIDAKQLTATMQQLIDSEGIQAGEIVAEILEDKDWEREWMDNFKPIQCGERLWIVPSWLEAPDSNAINLKLDPGLAFGTGTHPTTFLCLRWLAENIQGDEKVLDFGCGSGILGIAALLLGAQQMTGTDIDPQAISATIANAEANGIKRESFSVTTEPLPDTEQYNTVIANILAGTLIDLKQTILSHLKPKGSIVLSGILAHQADMVIEHYRNQIQFEPTTEHDGWVALSGIKTG
ncbi:MAG: 50S ribosomal protein L11 methyltransferase [Reinekea sp.]